MKNTCCTLLCAVSFAVAASHALAADVTVDSTTLFGIGKRDVTGASKETLMPATQLLGLDVDKLGDGNLSLHLYGWGRLDLADKSYDNQKSDGSLTYGYLHYRFNQANANIRAGRFFVREGIVNEQVDGVSARTDLPLGFGVSAFGGATVHTTHVSGETSDGKGDALFGGRVNYRYKGLLELGASGVYESAAPTLVNHATVDYRRIGGDIWLTPVTMIDLIGHSSYNPETQKMAEHSYLLNIKPISHLTLTGEFNQHREQSYLYVWTMFSGALINPNDKSSSAGGSASYELNKNVEVAADYKHYTREFGNADRFGGDARFNFKNNSFRSGVGYHYLNAGQEFSIGGTPSASYHELRCYTMHDGKNYFAALDILGDFFKEKIYGKSNSWETTGSLGYRFTPALALSGDVSYGRNAQFTEEVRGLIRLTYNMTYNGIGGKK
jgi:opacity protein-like surface antigen